MYEGDAPRAEQRAAALALDRDLLRELLGAEELRELIDPEALAAVEEDLQRLGARAARRRSPTRCTTCCARLGDLSDAGAGGARGARARRRRRCAAGWSPSGAPCRSGSAGSSAGSRRRTRASTATRVGAVPPGGLPEAFLEPVDDALGAPAAALRAHARPVHDRRGREPLRAGREATRSGRCGAGGSRGAGARRDPPRTAGAGEREWCDPDVLRRLRRASIAALRQEIEPTDAGDARALRPLVARHRPLRAVRRARRSRTGRGDGAGMPLGGGPDRLREVLAPLQGVALSPEVWERDVLPRRLGRYDPAWLDRLCSAGEVVWAGAGAGGGRGGRVALYFREDAPYLGPPPPRRRRPGGRAARRAARAARARAPPSGRTC